MSDQFEQRLSELFIRAAPQDQVFAEVMLRRLTSRSPSRHLLLGVATILGACITTAVLFVLQAQIVLQALGERVTRLLGAVSDLIGDLGLESHWLIAGLGLVVMTAAAFTTWQQADEL